MSRWRDIGGGRVQCDNTGEVANSHDLRMKQTNGHYVYLDAAQWAKLKRLAKHRSTARHTVTPEAALDDMIEAAIDQPSGWEHPGKVKP